ncbi:MAG: tRNA (5-methylaminomethyl-2-thiouridine)(34)-methyltransferase MnmD [Cyclobacteriaceae bacterium]|nr:tRNA (5-methylaminomethyl-2-thiouridine)(34)-methyltransferase MnmD [Cyclobacteriaceae bacterium]
MTEGKDIRIIETEDGSHSLELPNLNETYHSKYGAIQESEYVYIKQGFSQFVKTNGLKILEIGFGTGLNALLTLREALKRKVAVEYHTVEAYPILPEVYEKLNYGKYILSAEAFLNLHQISWDEQKEVSPYFKIKKYHQKVEEIDLPHNYFDLVYFDAFAPSKQADIWSVKVLEKVGNSMATGGKFVTYCAQGAFKRNLKTLGFKVEELQGPPGKMQMIRAVK